MNTRRKMLSMKINVQALMAILVLSLSATVSGARSQTATSLPLKLTSPDNQLEITFTINADGAPVYQISFRSHLVIASSSLALDLKQGGWLGRGLQLVTATRGTHDENYPLIAGKMHRARDHYNELFVSLKERDSPGRSLDLIFRAYDDGAAFRYRLPAQSGMQTVEITAEHSEFRFPTDYSCWAAQFGSFTTNQEQEFDHITSSRITPNAIVGLPLVCRTIDESATFALAEADLQEYAGMYFRGLSSGYGVASRLSPRRDDPSVAVRRTMKDDSVQTPWRVAMIGDTPGKLIESTLITNLNPPNAIGDTSWIRPGKAAWDWWSGPLAAGVKQTGMNDETMKYYIDFADEMGFEYMLVDAGWYSKAPFYGEKMDLTADITKPIPEINLPGLIAYARDKGVGIFVWTHWRLINDQMDKAFSFYERLGIKGVKIDFMDRDDQEMVEFYHRVMQKAASHHLMIDMHGAYKPTGLVRTYPNYITQEGVMGAEYNKWSAHITATHNVTLTFTRMLVGPMDYTPGGFRNLAPRDFKIQFNGPFVMTTRAQQLAMYVVYDSPFACVADAPEAYRGQAGADFLKVVPSTWDETRVLAGEIGKYIVIARRHGTDWYLGAMTNEDARDVQVPLDFLGSANYQTTIYADGKAPAEVSIAQKTIAALKSARKLTLKLAPSGGSAARFAVMK
jgi:alpha-glucosidase